MKTHIGKTLSFFIAPLLFSVCVSASATPKAAEHENAPVTMGADVERPRALTKPAKTLTAAEKKTSSGKTRGASKTSKVHKTTHGKIRGR